MTRMTGSERERGVALLAALTVVGLLVALVLPFNQKARVDVALAANVRDELKALYVAQSGLALALAALRADTTPEADGQADQWASFRAYSAGSESLFNEGSFEGEVTDANTKMNINRIINSSGEISEPHAKQLKRLFDLLGLDQAKLDAVLDWLDSDSDTRPFGAEGDWYEEEGRNAPANGPLTCLAELLQIKDITEQDFFGSEGRPGLKDVLTVSSDGAVNLNTASALVIASLSEDIDEAMAANIVASRQGKNYGSLDEITDDVPGFREEIISEIGPLVTLKSSTFLVEVLATCNEARKGLRARVRRVGQVVGVTSMGLI
jgi:general secretion pathway protein K